MKNEIQVFNFEQSAKVSVITDESNNPWWVAKEVCEILGIANQGNAISRLDNDEKDLHFLEYIEYDFSINLNPAYSY